MFTIKGFFQGDRVVVNWEDGKITSKDKWLEGYIEWYTKKYDGKPLGPVSMPAQTRDRLLNRESAYVVLYNILDSIVEVTGDEPQFKLPNLPKGVVI